MRCSSREAQALDQVAQGDGAVAETILAISTPAGRGGIGIVRLSGPEAVRVAARLVRVRGELGQAADHARARMAEVVDPVRPEGAALDAALVTVFLGPRSYTGEDLVEIAAHGSPVVLEAVVRAGLAVGREGGELSGRVRLAEPGEFTRRAFLAGRLDLTQAEAVQELIEAQTLTQARVAAQQMGGGLSQQVAPVKSRLVELIAHMEAALDFASGELDDVETVPGARVVSEAEAIAEPLAALASAFERGQLLRRGAAMALVGAPNAGKSSLFNRLLQRERAIVTPLAGTTRDTLEEAVALGGIPLRLVDTAGLRAGWEAGGLPEEIDPAEQMGMQRTLQAVAEADLVLLVLDAVATASVATTVEQWVERLAGRPLVVACNKSDLLGGESERVQLRSLPEGVAVVATSALTGAGVAELQAALLQLLTGGAATGEMLAAANLRQQGALQEAVGALRRASALAGQAQPTEVILLELHAALQALDSLTGETSTEAILERIFASFCIGK